MSRSRGKGRHPKDDKKTDFETTPEEDAEEVATDKLMRKQAAMRARFYRSYSP